VQADLTVMRRARELPYDWLADNTRWQRKPRTFDSVEDALSAQLGDWCAARAAARQETTSRFLLFRMKLQIRGSTIASAPSSWPVCVGACLSGL
jgi:hypothetical protein